MLPALPAIGRDLGTGDENESQLVVSALFLGLAVGQILYGPLSDSIGRKPAIYTGLLMFVCGCVLSMLAANFEIMLLGRVIQGFGAASARIVTMAMVRDLYAGREMARVMSLVMSVFIMVPVIAPALGQAIESLAGWRAIFLFFLLLAVVTSIWFAFRLNETLAEADRVAFSMSGFLRSAREVCTSRIAFGYSIVAGLIFGAFVGYLSSSQQILQQQYALGFWFPLYFAVLALAIGAASFVNARSVISFGMRRMSRTALLLLSLLSFLFLPVALYFDGHPALWLLMAYLLCSFFCIGILFGNVNALAMEPLGHIIGVGSAVVGSVSTLISVPLGVLIGACYDGSVVPLVTGFSILAVLALLVMYWIEKPASSRSQ